MTIHLTSKALDAGAPIPRRHARDGDDLSPPLRWNGLPEGTAELALICDDPDAPRDEPFVHWVLYGIPPGIEELTEGTTEGTAGANDWNEQGYGGPQPPRGHGVHHYHFRIYALDQPLALQAGADKGELLAAMRDHVLDEGELVATYER